MSEDSRWTFEWTHETKGAEWIQSARSWPNPEIAAFKAGEWMALSATTMGWIVTIRLCRVGA